MRNIIKPYFIFSDTGTKPPESCIFSQFLNMCAALCKNRLFSFLTLNLLAQKVISLCLQYRPILPVHLCNLTRLCIVGRLQNIHLYILKIHNGHFQKIEGEQTHFRNSAGYVSVYILACILKVFVNSIILINHFLFEIA